MGRSQPKVLVLATKWWPSSARMAGALLRHGCTVGAVCPAGHPLTFVSGIRHVYRYRGIFSLQSLLRALRQFRPEVVVPCDDGVVAQLHAIHKLDPSLRPLIERSLGSPEGYEVVESRHQFLSTAIDLGIRVPKTRTIEAAQELVEWHANVAAQAVLKVAGESGGNGVRISRSLDESLAAWRELRSPRSPMAAWKRLAIDREPLALWSRRQRPMREVTVQEFIPGRPANSMLVCHEGELLSLVSVVVVAAEGPTGAATIVRVIKNEPMKRVAQLVAARLRLSGFYGLDFIIEARTEEPYLIEMNPRCTQLGHIEFAGEGSLAGVFSAALRGEAPPQIAQNAVRQDKIALFPQAFAAGEVCRPYLAASYHDVPTEEPRLMAELKLKSWPQRRWASRLYHAIRPVHQTEPLLFEDLDTNSQAIAG